MKTTAAAKAMDCEVKALLVHNYSLASSDYSNAAQALRKQSGIVSEREYEKLRVLAEQARKLAEQVRGELDQHTAEHCC